MGKVRETENWSLEVATWSSLVTLTSAVRWSGRNESLFRVSTREEYEKASMDNSFEDTLLEGGAEKWGNY